MSCRKLDRSRSPRADTPSVTITMAGVSMVLVTPKVAMATRTEAVSFAPHLAGRLDAARVKGDVDVIGLAAPPRFLGMLRETLDQDTRRLVNVEIDKNLLGADREEIARWFREAKR